MSKSDVEMEDPEKLPDNSGNNLQESESKVVDPKVESEGKKSPYAAAALQGVNERGNGGKYLNKCITEVKDSTEVMAEVEDQNNLQSEASKLIEGSVTGNINTKSENEELINTETKAEEQTPPINAVERQTEAEEKTASLSAVENQIDTKNEVFEPKATNGGEEEDKSVKNGTEGGNHRNNVEKRPYEDVAEEKPKEITKKDMDYAQHVAGGDHTMENADAGNNPKENTQLPAELSSNKDPQRQDAEPDKVLQGEDEEMTDAVNFDEDKAIKDKEQGAGTVLASCETHGNGKTLEIAAKHDGQESLLANQHEAATPNSLVRCSSAKAADRSGEVASPVFTQATLALTAEDDDGTPEDQAAFMKELETFYRERAMDFKPPKFYGQPLNCLKLWRAVIRLGGYDRVTGSKLWRQVGESFHPPKTCTTVSWTFRIFYEKSLLEFERQKTQSGGLQLPVGMLPEVSGGDGEGNGYQGSGAGRARRDAAARAMQGWHAQRLFDSGEVSEPAIKDKNINNMAKQEKNLKSIGSLKQKRPNEAEHSNKAARTELSKQLSLIYKLATSVVDIGPPADWVKINVRQTKDCFEVYALVPGLLREEVRVQSDPAGRVVITGQPEQVDNPWGITPFKKVVSLPSRIDPVQTSAVVSLHGRLFIRVPFEQPNI